MNKYMESGIFVDIMPGGVEKKLRRPELPNSIRKSVGEIESMAKDTYTALVKGGKGETTQQVADRLDQVVRWLALASLKLSARFQESTIDYIRDLAEVLRKDPRVGKGKEVVEGADGIVSRGILEDLARRLPSVEMFVILSAEEAIARSKRVVDAVDDVRGTDAALLAERIRSSRDEIEAYVQALKSLKRRKGS
jgi:hypothetical protein